MVESVPYKVVNSGLLGEDMPRSTERVQGILRTTDLGWVERAERLGAVQRLDRLALDDLLSRIIIVDGALESDPVTYKIAINNGDSEGEITLSEAEIFQFSKFRQKFLAKFQIMLDKTSNIEWEVVIAPLIANAERIQDDTNDSPAVLEVLNYIEGAEIVRKKEELAAGAGRRVWLDEASNTLLVVSRELEHIAEKYNITLQRLSQLVSDYRRAPARQERIAGRRFQLWQFSPERVHLQKEEDKNEK